MESRVAYFRQLTDNPWFNVMNWVLDELRCPPEHRYNHYHCGWQFYNIPRKTFTKRRLKQYKTCPSGL